MSTNRLPVAVEIRVGVTEQGNLDKILRDANRLQEELGLNTKVIAQFGRSSDASRGSIRGLAFDLRLISSGLSILVREFEDLNPALHATARGFRVVSAALSAGLGTWSALNRAQDEFGDLTAIASSAVKVLRTDMVHLGLAAKAALGIFALLIAIPAGVWAFELHSGISALKDEIKDLNRSLEVYELQLIAIQNQTIGLKEDQALLNYVLTSTERAIEKQGYATERQAAIVAAAKDQQRGLNVELSRFQYEEALFGTPRTRIANEIREYEIMIQRHQREALERILPGRGRMGAANYPTGQLGGEISKSGLVKVEAGEIIAQREQFTTMMQGGGSGDISVSVSFPGAIINSGADMESAIRRGGSAAGAEIRRQLEMDRYRISRRQ